MTKKNTETTPPAQAQAKDDTKPTPKLTAAVVIRRMTGRGMEGCVKQAAKMTDDDRTRLVDAYESGILPRAILSEIIDRITDEASQTKANSKTSDGNQESTKS